MPEPVILGVGMHPFGRFDVKSPIDMGIEVARLAIEDARIPWRSIEMVLCGHMYAGAGAGHKIVAGLGATGVPIINLENACSSGGTVLRTAALAVAAGSAGMVLVVGVEKMPRGFMDMDYFDDWRKKAGHAINPVQFAFGIRRHMHEYGTTERQLAMVSVKNHANGVHNPMAMYRKAVTEEEVLASRLVVDPLRLLMLCAPNEGAAAAVVTSSTIAARYRPDFVTIAGSDLTTAAYDQTIGEHMPTSSPITQTTLSATARAV